MAAPPSTDPIAAARRVLAGARERRTFPAAVAEVGDGQVVLWREAFGALSFDERSPSTDEATIFDLASLTKPVATTTIIIQLVADGRLRLSDKLAAFFVEWRGAGREDVTVQDVLEHASGLAARLVDAPPETRREFEHEICTMPLEYAARTQSVYSDLGFILLAFLASDRHALPLRDQFDRILERVLAPVGGSGRELGLTFGVPPRRRDTTAPTIPLDDDLRRGRMLTGEVHDSYAALLGGVAGHSGLFGNAESIGRFARAVLRAARNDAAIPAPLSTFWVSHMTRRSTVPGSSRALGWDTMLPTSSCGTAMSPAAFGHTGFTGTSLWIDPVRERYFVLLTNRACGGGTPDEMRLVRRAFHDALARL